MPESDLEQTGLQAVSDDPSAVHTSTIRGRFNAIYADRAVSQACVICRNEHPLSPRKNYNLNDVMGGIIVSFPVK